MTTTLKQEQPPIDAAISENVNTCLHRAHMSGSALARALGMTKQTLARKMLAGPWLYAEVSGIANYFGLTTEELATRLPSREEWEERVRLQGFEPRTF